MALISSATRPICEPHPHLQGNQAEVPRSAHLRLQIVRCTPLTTFPTCELDPHL